MGMPGLSGFIAEFRSSGIWQASKKSVCKLAVSLCQLLLIIVVIAALGIVIPAYVRTSWTGVQQVRPEKSRKWAT
jgi:formate hydrogenlyase subunit 3/multisubunit Na+/H+ antiporter MnhD subunit